MEEPFYVLKTSEIFPYDVEVDKDEQANQKKTKYLRPEFICSYERPLGADTFKKTETFAQQERKNNDEEVCSNTI